MCKTGVVQTFLLKGIETTVSCLCFERVTEILRLRGTFEILVIGLIGHVWQRQLDTLELVLIILPVKYILSPPKSMILYTTRLLSSEEYPKQKYPLKQLLKSSCGFLHSSVEWKVIHISNCDILVDFVNNMSFTNNRMLCKVCLNEEIEGVFRPFGHVAVYVLFSQSLRICCISRTTVNETFTLYICFFTFTV